MRTNSFKSRRLLVALLAIWLIDACSIFIVTAMDTGIEEISVPDGEWDNKEKGLVNPISITKHSQYLTIQDYNPVNTITVRITHNDSGTTVFENVYPKGQTSFIMIPMNGWSAGSYTIELFGRENNGYLWGTFQVLP